MSDEILEAKITFVKWRGEIIAFFRATREKGERVWTRENPRPSSACGHCAAWLRACYCHVGQHGEADERILYDGRRATPDEYAPLLAEMNGLGYEVTPHQRGRLKLKD